MTLKTLLPAIEKMSNKNISKVNWHRLEPDYSRPVYNLPASYKRRILNKLQVLYGKERGYSQSHREKKL